MFNIILILFYFNILIKKINSNKIPDCGYNSKYDDIKCSQYGNLNYKMENGKEVVYCQCNKGYTSYNIDHKDKFLVKNNNNDNKDENDVFCCYEQKSILISFLLELFIGFGMGHFYFGHNAYATIKLSTESFLCVGMMCVTYYSCIREHPFHTSMVEVNNNENNENIEKNNINKNNKENEGNEENVNENIIDNKNNESKDESFELEENKENERMFQNFISCPKTKFFIYLSIIFYFSFNFIDAVLIAFGVFRDENGEELYLGVS